MFTCRYCGKESRPAQRSHFSTIPTGARRGNENHIPQANDMLFILKGLGVLSSMRRANWMVEYDGVNIGFCSFVGSFTPLYFNQENDAKNFAEIFSQREHPFHLNRLVLVEFGKEVAFSI